MIPDRFQTDESEVSLETYFSIARGNKDAEASEMTKWFDTNYHYIVPEISNDTKPHLTKNRLLDLFNEAKAELGIVGKPVIVGPITLLKLAKGYDSDHFDTLLDALLPLYVHVLAELQEAGAEWVQIDEPILVKAQSEEDLAAFSKAYAYIKKNVPDLKLLLQTYFEAVDHYQEVTALPVDGFGLDFVAGKAGNLAAIKAYGFPKDKVLAAGVVDGRNIWKTDLSATFTELQTLLSTVKEHKNLWVTPSSSLLHVPVTVANETELDPVLKNALAFADEN
ncbi:5-methyltetrahydropteroyltriglutamate-homocysteine methyltransferase [Sporolactobacillus inulinus]|uniref:5-methyltetrahydropteroyltriglutamate-homocysteine methyltransferase n=1 Tax=Sporolactobacillus inulinus TaxID=2078 RepID=A0A4Y1Z8X2_9BACL|nr:5-methyltetrahydropteroyltriglutamate-homocysteine methyltransferase [Sporolactobacillus inulinus]